MINTSTTLIWYFLYGFTTQMTTRQSKMSRQWLNWEREGGGGLGRRDVRDGKRGCEDGEGRNNGRGEKDGKGRNDGRGGKDGEGRNDGRGEMMGEEK